MPRFEARLTLPDGREVVAVEYGHNEFGFSGYVLSGEMGVINCETGEELSAEDLNTLVAPNTYLHEWISQQDKWQLAEDEPC